MDQGQRSRSEWRTAALVHLPPTADEGRLHHRA